MKHDWEWRSFEACLEKVIYTKKLQSSDYLTEGKYPIVSQEEDLISGYWDNDDDIFKITKPIVIFGDHTRVLKYIDFNFVLGADGVKILQPIDDIRAKFLYYYLKWFNVPSLGYSRHYKLLKECSIPVPPLPIQQQIVDELDKLSEIIEKKKKQVKELDILAQSIFYDMFGDPVENEKGWEVKKLGEVCLIKGRIGFRGYTRNDFVQSSSEGAISLSPANIIGGSMNYEKCSYISWDKYYESPEIMTYNGDILLVKTGSSFGKCAMVQNLPHKATINPQFVVIKEHKIGSRYLTAYLQSEAAKLQYEDFVLGTATPTFSQANLGNLRTLVPPLSLQQTFAQKIEAIEKQKELINQSIKETQLLFDSRMDYYFGE